MDDLNIKKIVEKLIDTFLYAGQTSINLRNKGLIKNNFGLLTYHKKANIP